MLGKVLGADEDSDPAELCIGSHQIPIEVQRAHERTRALRDRWQREHMKINRHHSVPLPLALLEHRDGNREAAVLITERSDPS